MQVLLINSSDIQGGAARAAYRLHQGLQYIGVTSHMLVHEKSSNDKAVFAPKIALFQGIARAKKTVETLPLKFYRQRSKTPYSLQWLPDTIVPKVNQINPDIINLHWINAGFMQIETITKLKRPLVWTLHDMWPFTGGCHYSGDCEGYLKSCGGCPQLGSNKNWDLSSWTWQRKAQALTNFNLTIVSPSTWLANCARASSLFKNLQIEVIPNGIDTQKYRPINKRIAQELLNLPQDKQLILFGALHATSVPRKGFHLLKQALESLSKSGWKDRLEVAILGASQPENPPDFGFKAHYLGICNDDISLALVYSAADVFVLPSIEENLANTVMEAIACATPCVAFNIGGTSDMIEHEINGYLAQPFKTEDLAQGIAWVLQNQERYEKLSYRSREKAEQKFSLEIQANRYVSLFEEIVHKYKVS
ncbi:group 1 glycosyl transferase [Nostoc sp. NIES-4103]|nr:group 1 glycosyl transferase [Nostoc sp. NIES-4103]